MLDCNGAASPSVIGGRQFQCRAGQAILSFENISTADGMTPGATADKNSCSSVPIWTKRTSKHRWMRALFGRRMGSIHIVGRTSATRFHLGILLVTLIILAIAGRHQLGQAPTRRAAQQPPSGTPFTPHPPLTACGASMPTIARTARARDPRTKQRQRGSVVRAAPSSQAAITSPASRCASSGGKRCCVVASLGFVPMALATGTGAEVRRPGRNRRIGGLISATLLSFAGAASELNALFGRACACAAPSPGRWPILAGPPGGVLSPAS